MCLNSISDKKLEDGIYYKVFCNVRGHLYCPYFDDNIPDKVYGVEYQANIRPIIVGDLEYKSGFHVFTRAKDAERYADIICVFSRSNFVVKKVKMRGFLACGLQHNMECGVFEYMTILDDN